MVVITLKDFEFAHILEWEEEITRIILKKRVIGKIASTKKIDVYVTMPKIILIKARVNASEKTDLWSIYEEARWQGLNEDGSLIDNVWVEEMDIRWDANLGCGDRQFLAAISLVCSTNV